MDSDFIGPVQCIEIAAENAGIVLTAAQTVALANSLVDIGADFTIEEG